MMTGARRWGPRRRKTPRRPATPGSSSLDVATRDWGYVPVASAGVPLIRAPVTGPMSTPGRVGVAEALAACSRWGTGPVRRSAFRTGPKEITATRTGMRKVSGLHRGHEESNAAPPETELLAWGSVMGPQERAAYDACAAALDWPSPRAAQRSARGWRTSGLTCQPLANRAVFPWGDESPGTSPLGPPRLAFHPPNPPRPSLDPAASVSAPRTACGTDLAGPHQRRAHRRVGARAARRAAAAGPRADPAPAQPPALPDDPLPTLYWLLSHADEGLRLTARHYIAPALVTEAVDTFGWRDQLVGTLRQELDVFPLHTLRGMAQSEMGPSAAAALVSCSPRRASS